MLNSERVPSATARMGRDARAAPNAPGLMSRRMCAPIERRGARPSRDKLPVCSRPIECRTGTVSQLGLLLPMMTEREFRRDHEQVAVRLRSVAATTTTSAVRARIIEQAEAHERLARQLAELGVS